nr:RICIN domain-containing protein [Mucilaginibacter rubeus]
MWTLVSVESGYYKIVNLNSGKALDVYGASTDNGGLVKQFTYTGGNNQQWVVTRLQ